jgi:hypothetical protein
MKKLIPYILSAIFAAAPLVASDFVYHGSFLWNDVRAVVHRGDFLFCAFRDGVGSVNLALDFNKKKLYSTVELTDSPRRLHLFGDLLAAENEAGGIDLVDVGDPADMKFLGSFMPEFEIHDLECLGDYLYAAVEYYGAVRYDISDPANISFDDSSMVGIRVTRLQVYDTRLYALDDYNGILIYEPDTAGFGAPVSELLLPSQAISFHVFNDTVYAGLNPSGYMVGLVSDVYNPQYLEDRSSFIRGDQIFGTPEGLVFSNSISGFELIFYSDILPHQLFPITEIRGYPQVFEFGDLNYIAYPHEVRGFVAYHIDDPLYIDLEYPDFVYAYPGPINQLEFVNSRLHVVGTYNWYEMYDLTQPDTPVRSGKMINPPYKPVGMCAKGDTIFVADRETNTFFPAIDNGYGDPDTILTFISVIDDIGRPDIIPDYFGDMDLLYYTNEHRLNGSARNDAHLIPNLIRWQFPTGIKAVSINDTHVYIISDKGILFINEIDDEFHLLPLAQVSLPSRANQMIRRGNLMYIAGTRLRTYRINNPLDLELVHTADNIGDVYEMKLFAPWLICGTASGIHIFDVSGGIPLPLFSGGSRAALVAYDDHIIAASDSHSVKIYTLPASDVDDGSPIANELEIPTISGYPNPFNPEITLVLENFSSRAGQISLDVYDILGRRVRRLPVYADYSGRWEVRWDGRDEDNRNLPSGVYFFKAGKGTETAVFKGILLK